MLSFIISIGCGLLSAWGMLQDQHSTSAAVFTGVGVFIILQIVIGLVIRKMVNRRQNEIQNILMEAQNKIQKRLNFYQMRPGSANMAKQELTKLQNEAARKALNKLEVFRPYYWWNFMLKKQINTMKMQLHFQMGEDRKVDALLPQCLLFDPQSIAIKMARMYRNGDAGLDKFYRRKCSRLKGDNRAFLTSVYAWIKVKQDECDKALDALNAARKLSDHQSLIDNCENLANNRKKHYSNSAFGDLWYALRLEEPKVKTQRQSHHRMF